jgi:hypothetical protein
MLAMTAAVLNAKNPPVTKHSLKNWPFSGMMES